MFTARLLSTACFIALAASAVAPAPAGTCGGPGAPCCSSAASPGQCNLGATCAFATNRCVPCGAAGQACCVDFEPDTALCQVGTGCDFETATCAPCGEKGQPCCDNGLSFFGGACTGRGVCDANSGRCR